VKIIILKLTFAASVVAPALCFAAPPSHAGLYGDSKWCAVMDEGAGVINWDCEYETIEDCTPAVIVGTRGFCQLNPYWRAPDPPADVRR
jgi:hypothetical protein